MGIWRGYARSAQRQLIVLPVLALSHRGSTLPFLQSRFVSSMNSSETSRSRSLSPNITLLGLVSLLTAMSSAMVYGLLPVFLVNVLGASIGFVGIMEGAAEGTNSAMRLLSGAVSDRVGRRKPIVAFG